MQLAIVPSASSVEQHLSMSSPKVVNWGVIVDILATGLSPRRESLLKNGLTLALAR